MRPCDVCVSPLVVDPAKELSVAVEARVEQIAVAHGTVDASLVIRDIIDFHYVSIRGYGQTTLAAQYGVCHFGNDTRKLFTRNHVHPAMRYGFTDGTAYSTSKEDFSLPQHTHTGIYPRDSQLINHNLIQEWRGNNGPSLDRASIKLHKLTNLFTL